MEGESAKILVCVRWQRAEDVLQLHLGNDDALRVTNQLAELPVDGKAKRATKSANICEYTHARKGAALTLQYSGLYKKPHVSTWCERARKGYAYKRLNLGLCGYAAT